jgi:hypothetical protein
MSQFICRDVFSLIGSMANTIVSVLVGTAVATLWHSSIKVVVQKMILAIATPML